jgi:subtilisin family serine protease
MLTIASHDSVTNLRSSFSNYNPTYVGLSAPGSNGIASTMLGGRYGYMEGTSMATPISVGAASLVIGLLKSNNVSYRNTDIVNIMKVGSLTNYDLMGFVEDGHQLDLPSLAKAAYALAHLGPAPAPAPAPAPGQLTLSASANSVAIGVQVKIFVSGGSGNYQWFTNGGNFTIDQSGVSFSASNAGQYTVSVGDLSTGEFKSVGIKVGP